MKPSLILIALALTALSLAPAASAETNPCGVSQQRCPPPHYPDLRDLLPTDVPYCLTPECDSVVPTACELQAATPAPVAGLVWGSDASQCDVDVDPIAACAPPSGQTVDRRVAFVHIHLLVCDGGIDPPPVTTTLMADPFPTCIRECSPVPNPGCQLQDATPAPLLHPLWGYDDDCTAEVSTACLGGADGSTDLRIAFLDVSLARCSGPVWS